MPSSYAELWTVLGTGGLVSLASFAAFAFLREKVPSIYSWRCTWSGTAKSLDPLPPGMFAWMKPLWHLSIEDIAERVGTDAASYIALLHYLVAFFCTACIIVLPVVVPTYRTGHGLKEYPDEQPVEELLRRGSISNVASGSWRLHVLAAMIWVLSLLIYGFLYALLRRMVRLRQRSEMKLRPLRHYTVLVEEIPEDKKSVEGVKEFFNAILENEVEHVEPVKAVYWKYCKLYDQYVTAWRKLKVAENEAEARPEAGPPMIRVGPCCRKVQAIPYYQDECDDLRPQLEALRHNHEEQSFDQAAFVTFRSLRASSLMQAALVQGSDEGAWRVAASPEPRDIVWQNIERNQSTCTKAWRIIGVNFLALLVVLYWAVPVAFTQTLLDLRALSHHFTWLEWIQDLPDGVVTTLQALLPVWALAGLNAAAVPLFLWLSQIAGLERTSTVHVSTMWMNFGFLLFNSFFIVISTGATLEAFAQRGAQDGRIYAMDNKVDSVSEIQDLLGRSLPQTGAFFMNFIAGQALYTPIAMAFPFALFTWLFYGKFLKSRKEKYEAMDPYSPWYGQLFSQDAFIFTLSVCFALVSPGVLIFTAMYFILKLTTYKYLVLFYYRTEFETGGRLLMSCVAQLCFGTLLGQLTVTSILTILEYPYVLACSPLPLATIGFTVLAFSTKGGAELFDRGLTPVLASKVEAGDEDAEDPRKAAEYAAAAVYEAEVNRVWLQPFLRMNLDHPRPRDTFWLWEDIKDSQEVHADDRPPREEAPGPTPPEGPMAIIERLASAKTLSKRSLEDGLPLQQKLSSQPEARGQVSSGNGDRQLLASKQALLEELQDLKAENQRLQVQLGVAKMARPDMGSSQSLNRAEVSDTELDNPASQTTEQLAVRSRRIQGGGCAKDIQMALARASRTICPSR